MASIPMTITITTEKRPCLVNGRRALFHRWADSARPVVPRGIEEIDPETRYQCWNVHGIVEFEDGTVQRIWPSEIQFVDGGDFDQIAWPDLERDAQASDDLTDEEQHQLQKIQAALQEAEDAARESGLVED